MCYFNRNPVEKKLKKYILKIFRSVVFFLNPFFFLFFFTVEEETTSFTLLPVAPGLE